MLLLPAVFLCLTSRASAYACADFTSCSDCTSHQTWFPNSNCRWCPKDHDGACHAELSVYNPCMPEENKYKPSECSASPTPAPAPAPPVSPFAKDVLKVIFKIFHIKADPDQCVEDVSRTEVKFAEFAADVEAGRLVPEAAEDLSYALSSLASAAVGCGGNATTLAAELRALAVIARDAKFVGAVDEDIKALASAMKAGDSSRVAQALTKLLADWTAVTQGCASGSKSCKFIDSLLKLLGLVASDVAPCEAAIEPALQELSAATHAFAAKNYSGAVGQFAAGLDAVAKAIKTDACGLVAVADAIDVVVPKLKAAIVKIESSGAVRIIVGSADIYDILYHAIVDLEEGDLSACGLEVGLLVSKLRASQCTTPACDVLEGLLSSLELALDDYGACSKQLDQAFPAFEDAIKELSEKHWQAGAKDMGKSVVGFAKAVSACGVKDFAKIAETLANQLNATGVATEIGSVVQVLVEGADVALDLEKLAADANAKQWTAVGHDLGTLSTWLKSTHCNTFVCKLLEGLLDAAAIPFQSLTACAGDLRSAEQDFTAGAAALSSHNYASALTYWAEGLDAVAKSVGACHLSDELDFVYHEAHVLGFGDIKIVKDAAQILIHGADFYEDLYKGVQAFEAKDYRTAGADLAKVMDQLSQWTKGHACTDPFCYVVIGILEFFGDIQGDIRNCKADFKSAYSNFSDAFHLLRSSSSPPQVEAGSDFLYSQDESSIKKGVRDIGYGLLDVAKGVADCHLQDLADIIEKLAVKLGIVPEVEWVEEVLHILIDGVAITNEVGAACLDFSQDNWVGFGYNIIKLIKTLLSEDALLRARGGTQVQIVV